MKCILTGWVVALLFCFMGMSWAQEGAVKLAEGVYGIKGPGMDFNTAFVVGERGIFVFGCDLPTYDHRMQAIRSVSRSRPIRFVGNGHYAFDDSGCNHLFAELGEFAKWPRERAIPGTAEQFYYELSAQK